MGEYSEGSGGGWFDKLCDLIIRPPRHEYSLNTLGSRHFTVDGRPFVRTDLQVTNNRGLTMECSHYEPAPEIRVADQIPCVVYSHGNAGSRVDGFLVRECILTYNMSFFTYDFSGCGQSEGEHISLGYYERDDLAAVLKYLRRTGRVSKVGCWGRSMGAVTTLLHSSRDPQISAICLDSPFGDLPVLMTEIAKSAVSKVPKFAIKMAHPLIRMGIRNRADFSIDECVPLEHVHNCKMPALFMHGVQDTFIPMHHSEDLCENFGGEKDLLRFQGTHNSRRPPHVLEAIGLFFQKSLMQEKPHEFFRMAKKHDYVLLAAKIRSEKSQRIAEEKRMDKARRVKYEEAEARRRANALSADEEAAIREEIEKKLAAAEEEWKLREVERIEKKRSQQSGGLTPSEEAALKREIDMKLTMAEEEHEEWLHENAELLKAAEDEIAADATREDMRQVMFADAFSDGDASSSTAVSSEQEAEWAAKLEKRLSLHEEYWKKHVDEQRASGRYQKVEFI